MIDLRKMLWVCKVSPVQSTASALQGRSVVARFSRCPMQTWGCSPSAGRTRLAWSFMRLSWQASGGSTPLQGVSTPPPCQMHTLHTSSSAIVSAARAPQL